MWAGSAVREAQPRMRRRYPLPHYEKKRKEREGKRRGGVTVLYCTVQQTLECPGAGFSYYLLYGFRVCSRSEIPKVERDASYKTSWVME